MLLVIKLLLINARVIIIKLNDEYEHGFIIIINFIIFWVINDCVNVIKYVDEVLVVIISNVHGFREFIVVNVHSFIIIEYVNEDDVIKITRGAWLMVINISY